MLLGERTVALDWLPKPDRFNEALQTARSLPADAALGELRRLAGFNLDFLQVSKLDRAISQCRSRLGASGSEKALRLAILGSSTLSHLLPGIRVAAFRRGLHLEIFETAYGAYYQALADESSELHAFRPEVTLLALDAHHLAGTEPSVVAALDALRACWELVHKMGSVVIQQTLLPVHAALLGNNEHRLPSSPAHFTLALNAELRSVTSSLDVHLLAIDTLAQRDGMNAWHDPALWYHGKQEVHPRASPWYGEHLARLLGALRGLSAKCLVLDLDNTLWGGVIGDDGVDGIVLGQGSGAGEAHLALQRYAKDLAKRGCILAVCSKNDDAVARLPFEQHSEMALRLPDIASFVANWQDKPSNLRHIAKSLNIGLDSLVFVDDNPFERELVRQELPMVAVPELPEDPALYVQCLASAGYFESTSITLEDRERNQQYQANARRDVLRAQSTDLDGYLRSLEMRMTWAPFSRSNLARITQLINKTNQFNLTTRRYGEPEVAALIDAPKVLSLQLRLEDRFGDNGIIGIVIGTLGEDACLELDTWLMSCRVLGRGVEDATLGLVVNEARRLGASSVRGLYLPTPKNSMVKDHYRKLGFEPLGGDGSPASRWVQRVDQHVAKTHHIELRRQDAN
jgi:FkbH-like protein